MTYLDRNIVLHTYIKLKHVVLKVSFVPAVHLITWLKQQLQLMCNSVPLHCESNMFIIVRKLHFLNFYFLRNILFTSFRFLIAFWSTLYVFVPNIESEFETDKRLFQQIPVIITTTGPESK